MYTHSPPPSGQYPAGSPRMRSASRSSDRTRFRASGTRCNRPLIEHPRRVAIGSLKPVAALQLVLACLSAVQAQAQVTPFTMPHAGNLPEQSAPAFYGEEGRGSPAIPLNATMALAANGPATGAPAIMGAASVGQTLTASKGTIADDDGLTRADNGDAGYAYEYQWNPGRRKCGNRHPRRDIDHLYPG